MTLCQMPSPGIVRYATSGHQWRAEAVGCPGPTRFLDALENIFYSSRKISDHLLKSFIVIFHFFASVVKFHKNSLLGCPPRGRRTVRTPLCTPLPDMS